MKFFSGPDDPRIERPVRPGGQGAPPVEKKKRHRLRKTLVVLATLFILLYFIGPWIAAPIVRKRLEGMVSQHLNASLTMDRLSYEFPYGVKAYNAALIVTDDKGQKVDLLRVKRLDLALAEIPSRDGPLVIEKIVAYSPSGHVILTPDGFVGHKGLVRQDLPAAPPPKPEDAARPKKEKPSDYFRLRRFEIHDGEVVLEDRRREEGLPWVVWKNLSVDLNIAPASGSLYAYDVTARNPPLALATVRGKFDVDAADLAVERFVLALKVERDKPQESLPPKLQTLLKEYGVDGSLTIGGTAHFPSKATEAATYDALIDLPSASARLASGERVDRLAVKIRVSSQAKTDAAREIERPVTMSDTSASATQPTTRPMLAATTGPATTRRAPQPPMIVKLEAFELATGGTSVRASKAEATIDLDRGQWRVNGVDCQAEVGADRSGLPTAVERALDKIGLSGKTRLTLTAAGPLRQTPGTRFADQVEYQAIAYPRNLTVTVPKWDRPFTNVSGTVRANKDVITVENVEGRFEGDQYFIDNARVPMAGIENVFRIDEVVGSAELTGLVNYPKPFDFVSNQLRPSGRWTVLGSFARRKGLKPDEKPEYQFHARSDRAGGFIGPQRFPLTDVKAEITIEPRLIDLKRVEATSLGGHLTVEGQISPGHGKELTYAGLVWVRDLDLKALANLLAAAGTNGGKPPSKLSGRGNLNARIDGGGADGGRKVIDNLRASGRFEVLEGDFWGAPVFDEVTGVVKVPRDALTAGQATGAFDIHDGVVELTDAAVSSPVLGLQGSGTVGFDGTLNLRVVAAPLADWRDQIKRTKIPIVSDVAGEVFGALQKMVNKASTALLYEMRVTGAAKQPKIETVPAPVLTEGLAKLFGGMARGENIARGLEERGKK